MRGFLMRSTKQRTPMDGYRWRMFLFAATLLSGVALGAFCTRATQSDSGYITYFIQAYLTAHSKSSFAGVMSFSFLSMMALQIIALLFSLSCIGAPVIACMPFFKGFTIGCVSSYLYSTMGFRGLFLNLVLLWLPGVLQAICLLFYIVTAFDTSVSLFQLNLLEQKATGSAAKIKRCLRVFLATSFGCLFSAVLEGALAVVFAPVFFT